MKLKNLNFVILVVFLQFCLSNCCFAEENSKKLSKSTSDFYLYDVARYLGKAWKSEKEFTDSGLEAVVILKITPDGNIEQIFTEKASINNEFNEAVYNTVRKCNPLPPFPKGITKPIHAAYRFRPEGIK